MTSSVPNNHKVTVEMAGGTAENMILSDEKCDKFLDDITQNSWAILKYGRSTLHFNTANISFILVEPY